MNHHSSKAGLLNFCCWVRTLHHVDRTCGPTSHKPHMSLQSLEIQPEQIAAEKTREFVFLNDFPPQSVWVDLTTLPAFGVDVALVQHLFIRELLEGCIHRNEKPSGSHGIRPFHILRHTAASLHDISHEIEPCARSQTQDCSPCTTRAISVHHLGEQNCRLSCLLQDSEISLCIFDPDPVSLLGYLKTCLAQSEFRETLP